MFNRSRIHPNLKHDSHTIIFLLQAKNLKAQTVESEVARTAPLSKLYDRDGWRNFEPLPYDIAPFLQPFLKTPEPHLLIALSL